MRNGFVLLAVLVLLSPALSAQGGSQQAVLTVSAQVVSSCRIDVQDGQHVRLNCASDALAVTRVSLNGHQQEPVVTAVATPRERLFMLPPAESVLASAGHDLAFPDRSTDPDHSIVVSIQF